MKSISDAIVIGAGIAGMTASIYLKRAGMDVILLEKSAPGGQINRTAKVENYPGFISVDGPTLSMTIFQQVMALEIPYQYGNVTAIIDQGEVKMVQTDQAQYTTRNVVIATGRMPKELGLPNEKQFIGRGVSWCAVCDGIFYKDKNVAVVGGGNSALEEALYLSNLCRNVYVIHRRDTFRADTALQESVHKKKNIIPIYDSVITTLNEKEDRLSSITIDTKGKKQDIYIEGLFIYIGHIPDTEFLKDSPINMENGYIVTDENMRTNIPHIYACGDVIKKELYQITTAVGDGAKAASSCKKDTEKN